MSWLPCATVYGKRKNGQQIGKDRRMPRCALTKQDLEEEDERSRDHISNIMRWTVEQDREYDGAASYIYQHCYSIYREDNEISLG